MKQCTCPVCKDWQKRIAFVPPKPTIIKDDPVNAAAPVIQIETNTAVSVEEVETLDQLTAIAYKFKNLMKAGDAETLAHLMTNVGDLSASVQAANDSPEDFADEVADVIITTFVVAANYGLRSEDIKKAIVRRIAEQSSDAVGDMLNKILTDRGFKQA